MTDESLFAAALALPPADRAAFLDAICPDPAVRREVEELLAANAANNPLDNTLPRLPSAADATPVGESGELIGGRYKLIEAIGEGGMGSVWMAEQKEPVKRKVAVKLIKAGMDSKAVLARFDAERQALAVMDHPNIARVFDGGLHAGRPYFVMELVKGTPITTFADARRLTPRQRLDLFVPVCNAIQHAHMKGVIHRDIKPSNVIVALYDDRAVPKVIDFGVAKATGQALTDQTLHTGFGAVVGTPEYMSPEQASLNNLDIDTRSDVYSLGVLLYELLTGSPPFTKHDLQKAGLLEMLRVVREVEAPRPSVKLSTAAARPSIAANRGLEPLALAKVLRSELDWLVMKALEKDRNRRYDSANGLAADVQRYLAGEAVQAVPPSLGYRVRKWVRKNKGLVTAAGLVAGTFTVGLAGTTWGLVRAEQEAERVRQEQVKTQDALGQSERNRERAEVTLVHSYLRPIGFNTEALDQPELIALDELARLDDDRIKLLFLREAMTDPERALRVARRAERVTQAAVGTSLKRREAALKLTSEKQRDTTADPRVRLCACWLAIELGSDDLPALSEAFETLRANKVEDRVNFLDHLPNRTHNRNAAALADALLTILGEGTNETTLRAAGVGLAALAPRLDPAAAGRGFDALLAVLGRGEENSYALEGVGEGLTALAPRLDPAAADRGFDALLAAFRTGRDKLAGWTTLRAAGVGLAALAPRLDPAAAGKGFDALLAILEKGRWGLNQRAAGVGLAALAPRLDPATAGKEFDALLAALGRVDDSAMDEVGATLVALALRLDAAAAGRGFDALLATFGKTSRLDTLHGVGAGLAALAPRLDPATAGKEFDALLAILLDKDKGKGPLIGAAGAGLAALAPRLGPVAAGKGFDALLDALGKERVRFNKRAVGAWLAALAPRLGPVAAGKGFDALFDALLDALEKTSDPADLRAVGAGLAALAPRLDPKSAGRAADALLDLLASPKNDQVYPAVIVALVALDGPTAQAKLSRAAKVLVDLLVTKTDGHARNPLADALTILASRLDVEHAVRLADALESVQPRTLAEDKFDYISAPFLELYPRLPSSDREARLHRVLRRIFESDRQSNSVLTSNVVDEIVRAHSSHALRCIGRVDSIPFLVELLRDPDCVGKFQGPVLARLEQLAYPDPGQAAVFAGLAADPLRALTLPTLEQADDVHRKQNRRFRTVSDAAKWLSEHHPEIDLDTPYHKAVR